MQKVFDVFADPGHAWAKVSREAIEAVGLEEGDFTHFSYKRGRYLYLEEDGDLATFIRAFKAKNGHLPTWREHHGDRRSRIRGYECCEPRRAAA